MTISSTITRWADTGDGVTLSFGYTNKIFVAADLEVYLDEVLQVTGFTVSGVGSPAGGTVDFTVAPAVDVSVVLVKNLPATQETDYQNNSDFDAEVVEDSFDRVTILVQQLLTKINRVLQLSQADPAAGFNALPTKSSLANKFLAFDALGEPIGSAGGIDPAIPVSTFIQTLLDDVDAATARATLGLVIGVDVAPAAATGFFTGVIQPYVGDTAPAGWLLLNGDTIGSALSGATQADAANEDLFKLYWNSMLDAQAPVSTGRGVSAQADWDADKTLTIPDARGRQLIGSGAGAGLTARVHGAIGGLEDATLVTHQHGVGSLTANGNGAHTHKGKYDVGGGGGENSLSGLNSTGTPGNTTTNAATDSTGSHVHTISGSTDTTGDTATDKNMPPWLAATFIVKL